MILALSVVSATLSNNAPGSVLLGTTEITFEVNATGTAGLLEASTDNGNISITAINASDIATVTISNIVEGFSKITGKINATDGNQTLFDISREYNFCSNGKQGSNFQISDFNIDNLGNGGDDEWNYLDEIVIEVDVENTHNDDSVKDVQVEIIILNSNGVDVTGDFDLDDEKIDLGRIKSDDVEVATFQIDKLKVGDLDEGTYRAYFKAYSDEDGEENKCVQDVDYDNEEYFEFSIDNEDLEDNFLVDESEDVFASCGEGDVRVSFDVWNLGDKEDKILVNLYGSALGVDEYSVIDDLRNGKEESVSFSFDMPDYASKEYYNLEVLMYYDYDKDDGEEFEESAYGEEVEDNFNIVLRILDCKAPEPTVSGVDTTDEVKIGDEISFTVDVKNNAPDRQNIIVTVENVDSWAELISVEPGIVTLDGGKSETVTVILKPTEEGKHTFNIKTQLGVDSYSQAVSVEVPSKWAIKEYFTKDYLAYWVAIALVVLILIVLISIIAVMRR